jgi:hypothetical protein
MYRLNNEAPKNVVLRLRVLMVILRRQSVAFRYANFFFATHTAIYAGKWRYRIWPM